MKLNLYSVLFIFTTLLLANSGCQEQDNDSLGFSDSSIDIHSDYAVNILIEGVPKLTPINQTLYFASNLNNWETSNPDYSFEKVGQESYRLAFTPSSEGEVQYKITQGAWSNVEQNSNHSDISNRSFYYDGTPITQTLSIENWAGHYPENSTATDRVFILDNAFDIPQLQTTRRVWVYLPPNYYTSTLAYPVLYMQDGQSIFDASTGSFGEWQVDETLDNLFYNENDPGVIVVAVDHGEANRLNEYAPFYNNEYNAGGGGEAYVQFLTQTLKPSIDNQFRTKPEAQYTAIAGSSMGGLMAQYAFATRPDVFGNAGILSPAFWFNESVIMQSISSSNLTSDNRVYYVASSNESESMMPLIYNAANASNGVGVPYLNINVYDQSYGQHSEWFWAGEFEGMYLWLFL